MLEGLDDPLQGLAVLLLFLRPGIGLAQGFDGLDVLLLLGMHGEAELVHMILVVLVRVKTGIKKGNCIRKLALLHINTGPMKVIMISEINPPTCRAGVVVQKTYVRKHLYDMSACVRLLYILRLLVLINKITKLICTTSILTQFI